MVRSDPPGAEVIVEGKRMGITPATILLDTKQDDHVITLRRAGYTAYEQHVMVKPVLEGPTQNCAAVVCSPCCFFLPLTLCYERTFSPGMIDAKLERDGQGLEVICRPIGAQVWIDGVMVVQTQASQEEAVEGNTRVRYPSDYGVAAIPLEPKVVKVEIRADGYVTSASQVLIRPKEYVHLRLDLLPVGAASAKP